MSGDLMSREVRLIALDAEGLPDVFEKAAVRVIFSRYGVAVGDEDEVYIQDPDIENARTQVTGVSRCDVLTFWRPAGTLIWRILFDLLVEFRCFAHDAGDLMAVGSEESLRRLRASGDWKADNAVIATTPNDLG
ncbi:hypothetical protein IU474_28725 [Nocardia otitidiscaviarum]|nr:hypothetical protein [Nocardia otitidiscaviarum]